MYFWYRANIFSLTKGWWWLAALWRPLYSTSVQESSAVQVPVFEGSMFYDRMGWEPGKTRSRAMPDPRLIRTVRLPLLRSAKLGVVKQKSNVSRIAISPKEKVKEFSEQAALSKERENAHESTFGPGGCASVVRSPASGTCVLKTNCSSKTDLSRVEFAFFCVQPKSQALHSFGVGGFALSEAFDTRVRCETCAARSAVVQAGPGGCASVFRSLKGTCVVQTTKCSLKVLAHSSLAFVCADGKGSEKRHDFNIGAFTTKGALDTGIACAKCLAPKGKKEIKQYSERPISYLKADVQAARAEVAALRNVVAVLRSARGENVTQDDLEQRAKDTGSAPSPAPALSKYGGLLKWMKEYEERKQENLYWPTLMKRTSRSEQLTL